ncbi:MAG: hypothetical protein H6737_23705 [Alphaproteobacteria bacterium]|nr:hypothetical protein [Alphaproteobacteria bacterium]
MTPVCQMCGTALPETGGCEACGAVRGTPHTPPETRWLLVGVRCRFTCKACGFDSPLDSLDGSGSAVCLKCGLHQVFDVTHWNALLPGLHAIPDLAGPKPEGSRSDPHWSIAPTGFADLRQTRAVVALSQGRLQIEAGPGHPLCETCREPVEIVIEKPGEVNTLCPGCGDAATYASKPADFKVPVVGAIGPEHRVDRAQARQESDGFLCGSCGAPLQVDGRGRLVRCGYCQAVSRIRVEQLQGLATPPPPDLWWLVFEGPSEKRRQLLREIGGEEDDQSIEDAEHDRPSALDHVVRIAVTGVAIAVGAALVLPLWFLVW